MVLCSGEVVGRWDGTLQWWGSGAVRWLLQDSPSSAPPRGDTPQHNNGLAGF
jgi:hypothetical protein